MANLAGLRVNNEIVKSQVVTSIRKNLDINFSADDSYAFLVDVINCSGTLERLQPMIKSVPTGKIDTLKVGRRKLRLADDNSNENPTGVGSITQDKIDYSVKKVFWDEWIKNDDVIYNAIRTVQRQLLEQKDITSTSDIEDLIISMIQKQFSMDLQDLIFNGDAEYPTGKEDSDFLRILNGFVKQITSGCPNVADIGDKAPVLTDFSNLIQLVPEEYKNNFDEDYVWIVTRNTHDKLVTLVQNRATGYGDAVLLNGKIQKIAGYPLEIVAGLQGPLNDKLDPSKGRKGFVALTPLQNLVPVLTQDVKYKRTGEGALALKKDSTYHIIHAYLDAVIRDKKAIAYMVGDKL